MVQIITNCQVFIWYTLSSILEVDPKIIHINCNATCNQPTYLNASRIGIAERPPGTRAVVAVVAPVSDGWMENLIPAPIYDRIELAHSQLEGP